MIISQSKNLNNNTVIYPFWENDKNIFKLYPGNLAKSLKKDEKYFNSPFKKKRYFSDNNDVTVINLGDKKNVNLETFRRYSAEAIYSLKSSILESDAGLVVFEDEFNLIIESIIEACITGLLLSDYKYNVFKKNNNSESVIGRINIITKNTIKTFDDILLKCQIITESIFLSRDLVNGPANYVTIDYMINTVKNITVNDKKIKMKLFGVDQLKSNGFNLILAVGSGGSQYPALVEMTYSYGKNAPNLCLVGKGVIFDTGGIDIKPSSSMDEMKSDMAGAANVIAIIKAASQMNLKVNITGLIPLVENSIDSKSYRPGDVYKAYNNKTVEIKNTDAEGRLILADALSYASAKKFDVIMDFATLTGASIIALGNTITACFTNNLRLKDKIFQSASRTGENIWELPLFSEYKDMLRSDIADLSNIGEPPRVAGCIIGALFLNEFVENNSWIHFDIAGPSFLDKKYFYNPKGGTGVLIRTIIDFIENYKID